MSKIARANQKIFGSTANAGELKQFGSLAAGTPVNVTDPEQLQALSNYLRGWYGASIGNNAPAQQDMNSICYLYAYQLAYLMQAGIAEWETGTTYYIGSLVNDATGIIYVSLTDGNIANAVSDTTNWKRYYNPTRMVTLTFSDTPYTVTTNYDLLLFNATSGNITATLPTAVGKTGVSIQLKKTDSSFHLVNIATTSSQTIDGVTTSTLATQNESLTIVSDGSNWQVLEHRIPSNWISYSLTIGGSVSAPTKGTVVTDSAFWRRVGDTVEIKYDYEQSAAGSAGSGTYFFPMPSGITINSAKSIVTSNIAVGVVGSCQVASSATGGGPIFGEVMIYDSSTVTLKLIATALGTNVDLDSAFSGLNNTVAKYSLFYKVPVTNWNG